ncbi:MAG: ABC transporter substrate-binding protein, partial [Acidimicrobiales bacterium]
MRSTNRRELVVGGLLCLALVATACGSSAGTNTATNTTQPGGSNNLPNQRYAANSGGTPVRGGTLTMLGTGDVDYMDPNVSYYALGYLALRMWSRNLYTYPAIQGRTTTNVPDLATAYPAVTNGGRTYSVTIRTGAMWNTSPPRQVTAADAVLGLKRACNPVQPFGGLPDFSTLIAGYASFCAGFAKVPHTVAAIKTYVDSNQIQGATVDPSNPSTIVYRLTKPTSYFQDMLVLPAFNPAPVEFLDHLPASNDLAQHTISDGPYQISSYDPARTLDFVRNPAWQASSDPIRKAYVDKVDITETGDQNAIEQQILTNTPQADMEFDSFVPSPDIPQLLASNNPTLSLESEYSSNPYVLFNTVSPNNGGAMGKLAVRQALEYALDRTHLIQNAGGPQVAPPLTQILPPGISGSTPAYDMYPHDVTKAKAMLASAGFPSGLTLKFLYRPASVQSSADFQTIQNDLKAVGITVTGVPVPSADFYTKYLQVPTVAQQGVWDLSLAGWSPDWYGDAAASFFSPLFDGRVLPPTSSNFGQFSDPTVNADIDKALAATTTAAAAPLWHQADVDTMKAAAIFPITDPNQAEIHGTQVHDAVYMAPYE